MLCTVEATARKCERVKEMLEEVKPRIRELSIFNLAPVIWHQLRGHISWRHLKRVVLRLNAYQGALDARELLQVCLV